MNVQVFTDSSTFFNSITSLCSMTKSGYSSTHTASEKPIGTATLQIWAGFSTQHNISDALIKDKKSSARHNVLRTHPIHNSCRPVDKPRSYSPSAETNAALCVPFSNQITACYSV